MHYAVINVTPQENYFLRLEFQNGEKKLFDMKPYLSMGIFQELKDINLFNSVRVSFDSIEWANQADIDPEVLYIDGLLIQ